MVEGYTPEIGTILEKYNISPTSFVIGPYVSKWIDPIGQSPREGNFVRDAGNFSEEACNHGRRIVKWPGKGVWHRGLHGNVTDCIQWDNGGIPYCPAAQGANISVQYNSHELPQKCTYDKLPRTELFSGNYDKYFDASELERAKDNYCGTWQNITTPECEVRLKTKGVYQQTVVRACLEMLDGQNHVAHKYPLLSETINGVSCRDAIIDNFKVDPSFASTIVSSGRIAEYCNDANVDGDTAQVKGTFDPDCSCVNMLKPALNCGIYANACQDVIDAGQFYGPGCPAGCAEKIKRDKMLNPATPSDFVAQVKNFFDNSVGGPYCFSEACAAGHKPAYMESIQAACDMNIQACFIEAENSTLDQSSMSLSCQQSMNIQDNTGCEYSSWNWTPCVNNSKTGTRSVTHKPTGKDCDDIATTAVCGDPGGGTGGGGTGGGGTGGGGTGGGGKSFWIIIGFMIAIMLFLSGFLIF
jgi:hypothetical protein